ncbi:hypothetical protein GOBAR_DD21473 [Gossypium barbadense]|nr:hypothetical protein GOBAR_DD21473 [Gossypium barbadense]
MASFNISATSSSLVFFIIIILLLAQVPTLSSSSNDNYMVCSKQFHCGNLKNVSYPFWGGDRPENCGQPGLKLACLEGEETQITIMSVSYKVIEINMDIQAFTVARTDYLQNLCPQTLLNTTLNFNLLSYAWNLENITLYYHCPLISNISSGFPSLFNCSTGNGTDMVNYYVIASVLGNLSTEVKDGLRSCDSHVIVPAFYTAVETIKSNPTPDTLVLPLGNGFGLKWDANIASKCEDCNGSGGRCGYNKSSNQFTCYCPNHTDASTCLLSDHGLIGGPPHLGGQTPCPQTLVLYMGPLVFGAPSANVPDMVLTGDLSMILRMPTGHVPRHGLLHGGISLPKCHGHF